MSIDYTANLTDEEMAEVFTSYLRDLPNINALGQTYGQINEFEEEIRALQDQIAALDDQIAQLYWEVADEADRGPVDIITYYENMFREDARVDQELNEAMERRGGGLDL